MIKNRLSPPLAFVLTLAGMIVCGTGVTLSLAPFNLWPAVLIGAGVFAVILQTQPAKHAFLISFCFGFGMYASGASWVYIAIHDFGMTAAPLALVMTLLFVSFLAVVFAAPFWLAKRWLSFKWQYYWILFPVIWILGEWLRSWLLTGFPWLYLGYGHIDTLLAGWAPIFGVYGVGLLALISTMLVTASICLRQRKISLTAALGIATIWLGGGALQSITWTSLSTEQPYSVALVQPNIPLTQKWDPAYRGYIMDVLNRETNQHWDKDIVLWPEAAIPLLYHRAGDILTELNEKAKATQTRLITGVLYDQTEPRKFYNSILGLGEADGLYFKQRLVPFGEYVPLENYLRGLIEFFDLPNSVIHAGPAGQKGLSSPEMTIAPFICYEVVYPDLVARNTKEAGLIVTISNDAWFGRSIGPIQHFDMARMRALENSRYVIRSTNTGISGIINHKGQVMVAGEQFIQGSFAGQAWPMTGQTPFAIWHSTPVVLFGFGVIIFAFWWNKKHPPNIPH